MPKKQIKKTLVLQNDQSDCGVACLKSIVQYYGGDIGLEKLRELSGTSKQGTTLLGLYQVANKIGFDAEGCKANIQQLIDHGKPVILHVKIDNRLQHYIVVYGYENGKFITGDPDKGIQYYNKEELNQIWLSKTCLTLEPNHNFQKIKNIKRSKKRWFIQLIRDDKELLGLSIGLGIAIASLGMAMAVFSQKLIDDILPSKDLETLILSIILVTFLLIIKTKFTAIRKHFLITQRKDFNLRIIKLFYNALLYLPKSFFDTRKTGELVARLNDTRRIQGVITQIVGEYIINLLITFVSIIFLFIYSWETGLISLGCIPVYFVLIYRFNKKIISSQKEVMAAYAYSESNYINTISGILEIKTSNKQPYFKDLNKIIYGNFQNKVFNLGRINVRLGFIAGVTGVIFMSIVLMHNAYMVYSDEMLIGSLMAILTIFSSSLLPSISKLALIAIPLNEAKVAFNRMYEFASISPESKKPVKKTKIDFQNLSIQNLAFRFPGRKQLLNNINIDLKKGELISLVGESGSGKSTLGYLLQKYYTPESGQILLNNSKALKDIDVNQWRNILGVVPQDIHIFNGTVIDNICYDNPQQEAKKVIKFLKDWEFTSYIENLPQGYATILGEEGVNLSGGQKQIIALARVLYKKPKVLILDEATAAMDRETEKFTIILLNRLKHEHETAIFYISHRLHVLKNISDRIYILEKGTIQDIGSHQELLERDNMYSKYWKELIEV
jgi:ATP-binding cassette subfamily B protein